MAERKPVPVGPIAAAPTERQPQPVPHWVPRSSVGVCLAGMVAAGYLTWEHFTGAANFVCPESAAINCVKVTTSSYSYFLGLPVAPLGLLFFAAVTVVCLPSAWRSPRPSMRALRAGSATSGVLMALYLIWAELFRINAICLWCTAVHILTIALFAIVAMGHALSEPPRAAQP
jgi:uncharacterized membrane protein